ncbi:MAG: hypothetical protein L6R28_00235 [Planctomycetes bacterium]|nr:hypothetical protein [Planctomycetota bacterium]
MLMRKHPAGLVLVACAALCTCGAYRVEAGQRNREARGGGRSEDSLKDADAAPDFDLAALDGKTREKLSAYVGKQPVALVFGSYT